ncbi:hypothetical protein OPT61_g10502 [Boeremia exigua]|uniref:Uncharacterized protein n=1 Tax=Boeremia exigua TaxID=749465 RepID=A0ACC2HPL2_9PLEO|nr:hypothetical protein OPT61_g10502 [Boeremia exigua]
MQVNSTVPITAEVFKARGVYNPKRLFGVTTLDVVRASRFISQLKNTDPASENITVVGGHSGATIVPLLSQSGYNLSGEQLDSYVNRVQFGGDEVVKAKDGAGSATLSMAMAGARFTESLLKAAQGQKNVIEPTFVDSPLYKDQGVEYFASNVELGPNGVEKIHPVGKVTEYEQKLLDACLADLKGNINKGVKFASENPQYLPRARPAFLHGRALPGRCYVPAIVYYYAHTILPFPILCRPILPSSPAPSRPSSPIQARPGQSYIQALSGIYSHRVVITCVNIARKEGPSKRGKEGREEKTRKGVEGVSSIVLRVWVTAYLRRDGAVVHKILGEDLDDFELLVVGEAGDGGLDDAADGGVVGGDEAAVVEKRDRAHDELAVEAVRHAAVAGDRVAKVLNLEGVGDGEVGGEAFGNKGDGVGLRGEDGVGVAFEAGEDVGAQVVDGADEVLVLAQEVRGQHAPDDGEEPGAQEALPGLLGGDLDQLVAAKGDAAEVGEDVVGDDHGDGQDEPDEALEDVVDDKVGLADDEEEGHVGPGELGELELHKGDEAVVGGQGQQDAVDQQDVLEVVDDALAVQEVHGGAEEVPVQRLGEAQAAGLAGDVGDRNDLLEADDLHGASMWRAR